MPAVVVLVFVTLIILRVVACCLKGIQFARSLWQRWPLSTASMPDPLAVDLDRVTVQHTGSASDGYGLKRWPWRNQIHPRSQRRAKRDMVEGQQPFKQGHREANADRTRTSRLGDPDFEGIPYNAQLSWVRAYQSSASFLPASNSATIAHALPPLSQALDGSADAHRNRVIDANGIVLAHVYGQPDGGLRSRTPG